MPDFLLILAALITIGAAIGVIASKEAVYSALFLTVHLLGVGSLFLALTHQFLAVAQMLVYAGAVMVVFMFAVTTLSPKEDPFKFFDNLPSLAAIAAGVGGFGAVAYAITKSQTHENLMAADAPLVTVQSFALDLFGPFLLPFEGTGFLLLVALIGAVILGGRRQLGDG